MYLLKKDSAPLMGLLFRIFGFLVGLSAICLQFTTNAIIGKGFMANHVLAYFTLQTNIFTTLIFLILIIKTIIDSKKEGELVISSFLPSLHLACTFYITITMLVYWLALAPMLGVGDNPLTIANTLFLHLFTPLCAIIDCVLFYKHGTLTYKDAFKWLAYPVLYLISLVIIANVSDIPYYQFPMNGVNIPLMYPYPFLDPQVMGVGGMIIAIIILMLLVTGFGLLYIFIDNKIAHQIEKKAFLVL